MFSTTLSVTVAGGIADYNVVREGLSQSPRFAENNALHYGNALVCRMRNCTTATESILLTRELEVGLPVVFHDAFEFVTIDGDTIDFNVVGEQVCAFLKLACLEFVNPIVTGLCLAGNCPSVGLCRSCRRFELFDALLKLLGSGGFPFEVHAEVRDPLVFFGDFCFKVINTAGEYRYPEAVYAERRR